MLGYSYFSLLLFPSLGILGEPEHSTNGRISGGAKAPPHSYRFVSILETSSTTTGSQRDKDVDWIILGHAIILSENVLLTHAEMEWPLPSELRITAGLHHTRHNETTGQIRELCHIEVFPGSTSQAKFSVLYLSDNLVLNDYIAPIRLPKAGLEFKEGTECLFATWQCIDHNYYVPLHAVYKTVKCKDSTSSAYLCAESDYGIICLMAMHDASPKNERGAPLICTKRNHEFLYGIYAMGCEETQEQAKFIPTAKIDRGWLENAVKSSESKCQKPFY